MAGWEYARGLHELGNGLYAYLQPDGSWGWSNAGLITDGEASLLVDTLYTPKLAAEMLGAMRAAAPAAKEIDVVVNTHANGDHCWGNQLFEGSEIVASAACAAEMQELLPATFAGLIAGADQLGAVGAFAKRVFGPFDFSDITLTPPTRTFDSELILSVGDKEVRLNEVGPAHTRGDVLVHVPSERTVFTGDLLFAGSHPVVWASVRNWIGVCDRILAMDVDVVVPGHGPISDKSRVAEEKGYFEYLTREARKRYDAGMSPMDAARDISLEDYSTWGEAERVVVNIVQLYREFSGDTGAPDSLTLFSQMAEMSEP